MTPSLWIATAYGVVLVTLIIYTLGLRRRLERAEQTRRLGKDSPSR